jgi:hypothetical protein
MTTLTENTRKILVPAVVLAVLVLSIALFFAAASSLAVELPVVGWILLALVVVGALGLGWLAWSAGTPRTSAKTASRELDVPQLLVIVLEALAVAVAVIAAFAWLSPAMGLPTGLVVPFALGLVSIVALLLDFLSKTGRLAERWRGLEAGASVVAVAAIVAALFYLAVAV